MEKGSKLKVLRTKATPANSEELGSCLNIQHISHYFALHVAQLFVGNQ
jgi:hypothetical protein